MIGENGEQLGVMSLDQAIQLARQSEVDLVEVAPDYDVTNSTSTLAAQLLMNTIGRILHHKNKK